MPPKKQQQKAQPQKAAAKKGGKGKKDAEFDAFLNELQTTTKTTHANDAKHVPRAVKKAGGSSSDDGNSVPFGRKIEMTRPGATQGGGMGGMGNLGGMAGGDANQQAKLRELLQQMMAQQQMMSPFLQAPKTDITDASKSNKHFVSAYADMQGWRRNMEDAHLIEYDFAGNATSALFAVFDGHAGKEAAEICAKDFPALITKHYKEASAAQKADGAFFKPAFAMMDVALRTKVEDQSGCTAVVCLVDDKRVLCSSVGDSRAVLCRADDSAVTLAEDHKPETEAERLRIEAAGGHVENNRVNGNLAMSRAMGDFTYKEQETRALDEQLVTAIPDVMSADRKKDDKFLIVCCDGIFDVLSNQELVTFVAERIAEASPSGKLLTEAELKKISGEVCQRCLADVGENNQPTTAAGTDNMTVVITQFKQ